MAWLEIGLIFVALLVLYKRFSLYGLLAFIAFVGVIGGIAWYQAYRQQAAEDKVLFVFRYDPGTCPADKPISTTIRNTSDRTVSSVFFDLVLRRRGFSGESGRLSSVRSDKILAPGEEFSSCYPMPSMRETFDPAEIDFDVGYKIIKFAD